MDPRREQDEPRRRWKKWLVIFLIFLALFIPIPYSGFWMPWIFAVFDLTNNLLDPAF